MKVAAIIPVAGKGKRFGEDLPKQYFKIDGKPIIVITLNKLLSVKEISYVIMVVSPDEVDRAKNIIDK